MQAPRSPKSSIPDRWSATPSFLSSLPDHGEKPVASFDWATIRTRDRSPVKQITRHEFAKGAEQHFRRHYEEVWKLDPEQFDTDATRRFWFLTRTAGLSSAPAVLADFRTLHRRFVRSLLGNNLARKKRYQPLLYVFADFAGSRHGYSADERQPHIHAVMMLHPNHDEALQSLMDVEPIMTGAMRFDPVQGSLIDLLTYAAKGAVGGSVHAEDHKNLWEIIGACPE
jgi:hypothetical protein